MLPIVPLFIRKFFARAFNNNEAVDATMFASLDAQIADCVTQGNQNRARLNAISTAAGSLRYALVSMNVLTATASQTAFTVTTYDNTAGASFVLAWSGSSLIAQSSITQTSTTVVTLPAQTVGTVVTIAIFGAGNGTSQLASVTTGQGAGLIGYANTTGLGSASDVENQLDEILTDLNSSAFLSSVLGLSAFIKADGSVDFTSNQSMGSHKITDLAAGTSGSNDAARMADITPAALASALGTYLSSLYVPISGATMTGDLDFGGSQRITNLPEATESGQPLTYDQINSVSGSGKNAIINGGAIVAQWADYAASVAGTFDYGKADLCKGALGGSVVSGTLTQDTSIPGGTGKAFLWSSVTTTGSGTVTWRFFIEAKDAIRFKNKSASFGCKFYSTHTGTVSVAVSVSKANSADDFSSVTLIGTSGATSAPTVTTTTVTYPGITMGDCSTGILVDVVATVGAVSNKNFEIGEVQFELGTAATSFEYEPYAVTLAKCRRYIEIPDSSGATNAIATGQATSTTVASFTIQYTEKRISPTVSITGANLTLTKSDGSSQAISSGNSSNVSTRSCQLDMTASAATLTAGNASILRGGATAGIKLDCLF